MADTKVAAASPAPAVEDDGRGSMSSEDITAADKALAELGYAPVSFFHQHRNLSLHSSRCKIVHRMELS